MSLLFHFEEYEEENFRKYGDTYVDFVLKNDGVIVTSKPEYIKKILIKDFPHFSNRMQPTYVHVSSFRIFRRTRDYLLIGDRWLRLQPL